MKNQKPHWVVTLSAALTPVVAIFGSTIALLGWRTNELSRRQDLFGRRYTLYKQLNEEMRHRDTNVSYEYFPTEQEARDSKTNGVIIKARKYTFNGKQFYLNIYISSDLKYMIKEGQLLFEEDFTAQIRDQYASVASKKVIEEKTNAKDKKHGKGRLSSEDVSEINILPIFSKYLKIR